MKRNNNVLYTLITLTILFLTPTLTISAHTDTEDFSKNIEELVKESQEYKETIEYKENKGVKEQVANLTNDERNTIKKYLDDKKTLTDEEKIIYKAIENYKNNEKFPLYIGLIMAFLLMAPLVMGHNY